MMGLLCLVLALVVVAVWSVQLVVVASPEETTLETGVEVMNKPDF